MKVKIFSAFLFFMLFAGAVCLGLEGEEVKNPLAVAPGEIFEFDPVLDGDQVTHNFVIQNKGDAELRIERVQTG
jgi:hypothetical protein